MPLSFNQAASVEVERFTYCQIIVCITRPAV